MLRFMLNVLLKHLQACLNYFLHFLGLALSLFGGNLGLRIRCDQQISEVAEEDVKGVPVCDVLVDFRHLDVARST